MNNHQVTRTLYVVKLISGYYNPFFGTQKTAKTASAFWTREEAQEVIERKHPGGEIVTIRSDRHAAYKKAA